MKKLATLAILSALSLPFVYAASPEDPKPAEQTTPKKKVKKGKKVESKPEETKAGTEKPKP